MFTCLDTLVSSDHLFSVTGALSGDLKIMKLLIACELYTNNGANFPLDPIHESITCMLLTRNLL